MTTTKYESSVKCALAIPWGTGPNEIMCTFEDYPIYSDISADQSRVIRAPIRIRIDYAGGIHALVDGPMRINGHRSIELIHFSVLGILVGKTIITLDQEGVNDWNILDFIIDDKGNSYVLESVWLNRFEQNRLRKFNREGNQIWVQTDPISKIQSKFSVSDVTYIQLGIDGQYNVYLLATHDVGIIARINPSDGQVIDVISADDRPDEVYINRLGKYFYILYLSDQRKRAVVLKSLYEQGKKVTVCDDSLYGYLTNPIGVDDYGNIYVIEAAQIARVSPGGKLNWKKIIDNIIVRSSDGTVYISSYDTKNNQGVLEVVAYLCNGQALTSYLIVPNDMIVDCSGQWSLISVDQDSKYYVFGGEEPGRPGYLLIFSKKGILEDVKSPPTDLISIESKLQIFTYWAVDSQGRIYFPVTDPEGFKVVVLDPPREGN